MKKKGVYASVSDLPISLCAEDIASVLGISRSQAYALLHTRGFPVIRVGKRFVVPREAFLAWMDEQIGANTST